jgi:hypothetical protein
MEGTPGIPETFAFSLEEAPKLCQKQVGGGCPQWQAACRDEHAVDPAAAFVEWTSKKTLNLCRFFAKGRCAKGAACTYLHVKTSPSSRRSGAPVKGAIKTQAEIDAKPGKDPRTKGPGDDQYRRIREPLESQPNRQGVGKEGLGSEPSTARTKARMPSSKPSIATDPLLRAVKQTRGKIRALLSVQQSLGDIAKHVGGDIQTKAGHTDVIVEEVRARLAAFNLWMDEQTQSIGFKAPPDEGINDASDDSA